jgi:hypothetical protein
VLRRSLESAYLLVVTFWLVGAATMAVYALRGGVDAARRPLELLTPRLAPASTT